MPLKSNGKPIENVKYEPLASNIAAKCFSDLEWLFYDYINKVEDGLKEHYRVHDIFVDEHALKDVIIRVDKYKEHAKIFHRIEKSSEFRLLAIYCYWIIRLQPFSVVIDLKSDLSKIKNTEFEDKNGANINEGFAVYLFMSTINLIMREKNINFKLSRNYVTELLYTLRYRDVDKNAMIMLFKPIMDLDQPQK